MSSIQPLPSETDTNILRDEERQPCEIWTRVMGYHRPMSSFNIGKKGEFHERKFFVEQRAQVSNNVLPVEQHTSSLGKAA